jgi:hypothetical protein
VANPEEPSPRDLPGLGLAAYVGLLGVICAAGVIGVSVAWYSVIAGGQSLSPTRVSYGGVVDPVMLRPLRTAGLLGPTEIPDAYHAEDSNGEAACALAGRRVVRLSAEAGAQSLAFDDIIEVTGGDGGVTIRGPAVTLSCRFSHGEGGASFRAMLDHRG